MAIIKAILPVAGLGSRVMPLTLHQPKGMIAIVDKPMVHYIIDELISVGIKEIAIVFGPNQEVFKNYLDYLKKDNIWSEIKFHFYKQESPRGNGDAIYVARDFINKGEAFAVAFCDDLFGGIKSPLNEMMKFFEKKSSLILLLEAVPKKFVSFYGIVKPGNEKIKDFYSIVDLVEKPPLKEAPSDLTIIGRYVFSYKIFNYLEKLYPYHGKEIGITDAMKLYINDYKKIWGMHFKGMRFDCGSKIGLVKAQAYFASNHPEIKKELKKMLRAKK